MKKEIEKLERREILSYKELENILHQASLLSNDKLVAEEHIFMAILMKMIGSNTLLVRRLIISFLQMCWNI